MQTEIKLPESKLTRDQKKTETVSWAEGKDRYSMKIKIRYDDECGNGHNTFSITGNIRCNGLEDRCGCVHDEIAKHAPHLAHLIKWHLVSSDGPMHYIANVTYHASDRDYNGLRKGEKKQLLHGEKTPVWQRVLKDWQGELVTVNSNNWIHAENPPPKEELTAYWEPVYIEGEGKEREFAHARSSAVWPEATDEQLSLPKEELEKLLLARHPALMAEFKKTMEDLGFTY